MTRVLVMKGVTFDDVMNVSGAHVRALQDSGGPAAEVAAVKEKAAALAPRGKAGGWARFIGKSRDPAEPPAAPVAGPSGASEPPAESKEPRKVLPVLPDDRKRPKALPPHPETIREEEEESSSSSGTARGIALAPVLSSNAVARRRTSVVAVMQKDPVIKAVPVSAPLASNLELMVTSALNDIRSELKDEIVGLNSKMNRIDEQINEILRLITPSCSPSCPGAAGGAHPSGSGASSSVAYSSRLSLPHSNSTGSDNDVTPRHRGSHGVNAARAAPPCKGGSDHSSGSRPNSAASSVVSSEASGSTGEAPRRRRPSKLRKNKVDALGEIEEPEGGEDGASQQQQQPSVDFVRPNASRAPSPRELKDKINDLDIL